MTRTLVAGVDTSTQSCKVRVTDAETGEMVRFGQAKHPNGTSIDPKFWWDAFLGQPSRPADLTTLRHWPLAVSSTAW